MREEERVSRGCSRDSGSRPLRILVLYRVSLEASRSVSHGNMVQTFVTFNTLVVICILLNLHPIGYEDVKRIKRSATPIFEFFTTFY